jgi:hypothetical protein
VIEMTPADPSSTLPPWKLLEAVATIGLAIVVRGAVRLIDDHAARLVEWTSPRSLARVRAVASKGPTGRRES